MTTRTPQVFTSGMALTATSLEALPKGNAGSANAVGTSLAPTTSNATTGAPYTLVTLQYQSAAGRRLMLHGYVGASCTSSTGELVAYLYDGTTKLGKIFHFYGSSNQDQMASDRATFYNVPDATLRTYTIKCVVVLGAWTITNNDFTDSPTLSISDVGPTF